MSFADRLKEHDIVACPMLHHTVLNHCDSHLLRGERTVKTHPWRNLKGCGCSRRRSCTCAFSEPGHVRGRTTSSKLAATVRVIMQAICEVRNPRLIYIVRAPPFAGSLMDVANCGLPRSVLTQSIPLHDRSFSCMALTWSWVQYQSKIWSVF